MNFGRGNLIATFMSKATNQCSTVNTLKNKHFKNFVTLVEGVQNGFLDEVVEEKEENILLKNNRQNRFSAAVKDMAQKDSDMKMYNSSYISVMTMNLAITDDIERFENFSITSGDSKPLSLNQTKTAFKSFIFLSADKVSLSPQNVKCWGKHKLSPVVLKSGGIMDQFPSKASTFDGLSTFCFPHGLSIRIIPKCAIEGANNLGWFGRKADRFQLHAVSFK